MVLDISKHPCFNDKVRHEYGRVHLPVAPACNIQCNFCDRAFDCMNETRPGVTSTVLTPEQALRYLDRVMVKDPRITVVGIAGPGDPFATPDATLRTLQLVREKYPDMILCVASNGLNVEPYVDRMAELNVSHVTITINAVDPEIGAKVYAWVRDGKRVKGGLEGAEALLAKQLGAVRALKAAGIVTKVNSIIIPGINHTHVKDVAQKVAALGADILNTIPLLPVENTPFFGLGKPPAEMVKAVRRDAEAYLPQMHHCTRCRADAVGLLGEDMKVSDFAELRISAESTEEPTRLVVSENRPYIAVASWEGMLINQHLGEANSLRIYKQDGDRIMLQEERQTPPRGGGANRWDAMAKLLNDCRAILVSGAGHVPTKVLNAAGVEVTVTEGLIDEVLACVFEGRSAPTPVSLKACGTSCGGNGSGMGCG